MEILKAFIFGIIEGITEWLPVSSTGHLILLQDFMPLNVSDRFFSLFEVVIQLGAILAVIFIYFKELFPWGFGHKKEDTKNIFNMWFKILVACLPAAVIGLLFDDILDKYLYKSEVVSIMLILYGLLFIIIESSKTKSRVNDMNDISYKDAFIIGIFQLLALIPGTSRSGATIIGGLLIGLKREVIAKFTFYLAIPVMAGASALKVLKYVIDYGFNFSALELEVLGIGCLVAFIVSLLVIKMFMNYIKKKDFRVFGYYRIILGIIVILYFMFK